MNPAIMRGVWRARGPLSKFDFLFILVEVVTHVCTTPDFSKHVKTRGTLWMFAVQQV